MVGRFCSVSVLLAATLSWGCQHASESAYPNDPLLLSKKPVEGTLTSPGPTLLAQAEPQAPPQPRLLAKSRRTGGPSDGRPAHSGTADDSGPTLQPIPGHRGPAPAIPAVQGRPSEGPPESRSAPHAVVGTYGHAPDYSWLQGELDRHYRGTYYLRFCDPTVAHPLGGKVTLEDDPRLKNFQDGDIIQVEGALLAEDQDASQGRRPYPRYRIERIWLVQRKR
ncbi:MAG: hypothetical protein NZ700_10765 [Gemmataceae bacterium]|nr:hypothetical protein [Gemmataceae bacterium]MDW8264212.1 hypothetical protein [Gemmataceae bacterium]